jgi:hypothetical protein
MAQYLEKLAVAPCLGSTVHKDPDHVHVLVDVVLFSIRTPVQRQRNDYTTPQTSRHIALFLRCELDGVRGARECSSEPPDA